MHDVPSTTTATTDTPTPEVTPARATRGRVRTLALGVTAVAAATVASAGLALGPSVAQADPGDTFVPLGTSQLLQSEDLAALPALALDRAEIEVGPDRPFAGCTGEGTSMSDVVGRPVQPVFGYWSSRQVRDQGVGESLVQAPTPAQAKRFTRRLLTAVVRDCQRPKYDFHFGPTEKSGVGAGVATWALSYPGDATRPNGGTVVFRKGTNVGVLEVSLPDSSPEEVAQTLEGVAKLAVHRLV